MEMLEIFTVDRQNISNIGNINADIIWSTSYWMPKNPI